jgi:hypothetical protein
MVPAINGGSVFHLSTFVDELLGKTTLQGVQFEICSRVMFLSVVTQ